MEHLRYSFAVLSRIVGVFAVAPATALFIMFGLAYQFSFHALAHDAYSYIGEIAWSQKETRPGFLTIRRCVELRTEEGSTEALPPPVCEKYETRKVSLDTLAVEAAATLSNYYWALVILGLIINMATMGPRRFFMMDGAASTSNDVAPAKRL